MEPFALFKELYVHSLMIFTKLRPEHSWAHCTDKETEAKGN